jgi:hypothetical protein
MHDWQPPYLLGCEWPVVHEQDTAFSPNLIPHKPSEEALSNEVLIRGT